MDSEGGFVAVLDVVRHGQTRLNAEDRLRGHVDESLDDTGHDQAHALANLLRDVPISRVVTSLLRRATRTAALSTGPHKYAPS